MFLDNHCTVSIMLKSYYDSHEILHKCKKMPPPNYLLMYTHKGDIKVPFWIVIPLTMQKAAMQLQLLGYNKKVKVGILFGKDTFNQLDGWKDYTNRTGYVKQVMILMIAEKAVKIPPDVTTPIAFKLDT